MKLRGYPTQKTVGDTGMGLEKV